MARPKKATVDYFSHSCNHGKTMFTIEQKYGNDGYAFFFKLLELLGKSEHHFYDCNNPADWEFLLAITRFSDEKATEILCTLVKLGSIDSELWDMKIIWSENFIKNLSELYQRRSINVYNKQDIMSYCIQKLPLSGISAGINPQSKVKYSIVNESKVNKIKENDIDEDNKHLCKGVQGEKDAIASTHALEISEIPIPDSVLVMPEHPTEPTVFKRTKKTDFIPPAQDEFIEYFKLNGYKTDIALRAFKGYSESGWKDSQGKPVLNWKQKCQHVWFKKEHESKNKPQEKTQAEVVEEYRKAGWNVVDY